VRVALALAERGETDFGIVYGSDAAASDDAWVVAAFDDALYPAIRYPLALLAGSQHPDSQGFADYLSSREGQVILRRHGFTSPD
jgi:molybdate transport system substrate-binding protein